MHLQGWPHGRDPAYVCCRGVSEESFSPHTRHVCVVWCVDSIWVRNTNNGLTFGVYLESLVGTYCWCYRLRVYTLV